MRTFTHYDKRLLALSLLLVMSRVLPHPPNMTLLVPTCLMLVARLGYMWGLGWSLGLMLGSDIILAVLHGWPVWGSWQWYVLSGLAIILLIGNKSINRVSHFIISSLTAGLLFWLWTNLGVWLQTDLYGDHINGLLNCYLMALPFLGTQLISDGLGAALVWCIMEAKRSYHSRPRAFLPSPLFSKQR